jgi:hypothetical protein
METAQTGTLWRFVSTRMPSPNPHSFAYPRAKKEKLGHTPALHLECPA